MKKILLIVAIFLVAFSLLTVSISASELPDQEPGASDPGLEEPGASDPGIEEPGTGLPGDGQYDSVTPEFVMTLPEGVVTLTLDDFTDENSVSCILYFDYTYLDTFCNRIEFTPSGALFYSDYEEIGYLAFGQSADLVLTSSVNVTATSYSSLSDVQAFCRQIFVFEPGSVGVLSGITSVFSAIGTWLVATLISAVALFWDNGLTFFGILAIVALGISLLFLLVRVVQNFLHFRS